MDNYDYVTFLKFYPFEDNNLPYGYRYGDKYGKLLMSEVTRIVEFLLEKGFYVALHVTNKTLIVYVDTKMFKQR